MVPLSDTVSRFLLLHHMRQASMNKTLSALNRPRSPSTKCVLCIHLVVISDVCWIMKDKGLSRVIGVFLQVWKVLAHSN